MSGVACNDSLMVQSSHRIWKIPIFKKLDNFIPLYQALDLN